jgi:hypothetical protein
LIQTAFSVFFEYRQNYPDCGKVSGFSEKTITDCDRETFWTRSMCHRACNLCVALYWAIRKVLQEEDCDLLLPLNRIDSHSIKCHFGMIQSTLRGDPRWSRFSSAQVDAVIIHRVMRTLEFQPYIRRFSMPAGGNVCSDTTEPVCVDLHDIITRIKTLSSQLSQNQARIGWGELPDSRSFITPFLELDARLDFGG